jgi:TfoX/Sxy family transcriptional regulator of competence genes
MAFDEILAERVRSLLGARPDVDERRMFGGIGFLIAGNMCCGVNGEELIARVDPGEGFETEDGARPFDMTGRPMRGWLFVSADAIAEEADLARWVRRAEAFASSLPPKDGQPR